MRNKLLALLLLVLLATTLLICTALVSDMFSTALARSQVTRDNFNKIKKGMLRSEVDSLFGKRPERSAVTYGQWTSEVGQARIHFDEGRRVVSGTWFGRDENTNSGDPWNQAPIELVEDR